MKLNPLTLIVATVFVAVFSLCVGIYAASTFRANRLLIVSDSIGYSPAPYDKIGGWSEFIDGRDIVHLSRHPKDTATTIELLGEGIPDAGVVVWNSGLWDVMGFEREMVGPISYEDNLRTIAEMLQSSGAKVVWVTTTPISDDYAAGANRSIEFYNRLAVSVMKERGIPTIDLGRFSRQSLGEDMLIADGIHWNTRAQRAQAEFVEYELWRLGY